MFYVLKFLDFLIKLSNLLQVHIMNYFLNFESKYKNHETQNKRRSILRTYYGILKQRDQKFLYQTITWKGFYIRLIQIECDACLFRQRLGTLIGLIYVSVCKRNKHRIYANQLGYSFAKSIKILYFENLGTISDDD